jgi:hypothetical protein
MNYATRSSAAVASYATSYSTKPSVRSVVQSAVCNQVGQTSSNGECLHLKVFTDARRSDPGKLAASCTSTTIKTIVTLKSHEKKGTRSEPIKQAHTSARRMHSFYTIPMGCGYLPGGCERCSVVNGSHDPRTNNGLTIVKRGVQPTNGSG